MFKTGHSPWNKGQTKDSDRRIAAYAAQLSKRVISPEWREKLRLAKTKHPWFDHCQECGREKGFNRSPRCGFCAARFRVDNYPNSMKGRKLSPEHKQKLLVKGLWTKQTKPEKAVQEITDFLFGKDTNPFTYSGTGDNKFFIHFEDGQLKVPDFISFTGKKVIEVYGNYWHRNDNPQDVIDKYRKAGWDCLVLWESEIKTRSIVDDIVYFIYPYDAEDILDKEIVFKE